MKKLFALMLALCLMFSVAMAETATEDLNWADVESLAAEVGGNFVHIDLGLIMWVPEGYEATAEVSDELAELGFIGTIAPADGSGVVAFQYVEAEGADFDDVIAAIPGAQNPKVMVINGIACVNFDLVLNGVLASCVAFPTEQNNIYVIDFMPMDNADFAVLSTVMLGSIQTAE